MASDDVSHAIKVFVAAYKEYGILSHGIDIDGPDPFWSTLALGGAAARAERSGVTVCTLSNSK